MNSNQGQAADEAATQPSEPLLLDEFDTLDTNLFDYPCEGSYLEPSLSLYHSFSVFDSGSTAFPQNCDGEINNTFSHSMTSDFIGESTAFRAPAPFVSTPTNTILPQGYVPGPTLPTSGNTGSLFTPPSMTGLQFPGPADWMSTPHHENNPLICSSASPMANFLIANPAVNSNFQLGTHTASGYMQSHAAGMDQPELPSFGGPGSLATCQPPNSSTPALAASVMHIQQLETRRLLQTVHPRQPEYNEVPFRPIAPKVASLKSPSLRVQGPLPLPPLQATVPSSDSKLKRSLSLHETSGFSCFSFDPSAEAAKKSKKRPNGLKYSQHTCLRCQVSKKKCSGTFPCENCLAAWENKATKATLKIQACFDSDVTELDAFSTFWDPCFVPGLMNDKIRPDHNAGTPGWKALDRLLGLLHVASAEFECIVKDTAVDAGLVQFIDQILEGAKPTILLRNSDSGISPQRREGSYFRRQHLYWMVAAVHLHPTIMARQIGVSRFAMWTVRRFLSSRLFKRVAFLIRKFKSEPVSMTSDDRDELIASLQTIQLVPVLRLFKENTIGFFLDHILPKIRYQQSVLGPMGYQYQEPDMSTLADKLITQQVHLHSLVQYWLQKLSLLNIEVTVQFYLVLLSRLDTSQPPRRAAHPIAQAIKFLSELGAEQSSIDALEWEKQNQSLGGLEFFIDYVKQLDTLKESMATSQQVGTPSSFPSQHSEQ